MALMNALKCQDLSQLPRAGKYNDGAGLLLHNRKDGGAILFHGGFIVIPFMGDTVKWDWVP
ncbi:phage integrase [Bartonella tribocorum]|uniref:Uncharacterized protein n=1 Tax=Bartonella tribocorum (strain DSM 28219 / CCUG 45778 / CIP 105476 / IBS 506) TaxID=382640 RepID=A9IN92_BART1|nr:hypothetical protein predicted by Glimmer/Critica [Bartonella tribocorum CIP 105476]CDO47964.1 phage integrase [Bartonella tribocorum]